MELNKALQVIGNSSLIKGGKAAVIGEIRKFGGRDYIKTADGWKFHGKGTGVKAQAHKESISEKKESSSDESMVNAETRWGSQSKTERESALRNIYGTDWNKEGRGEFKRFDALPKETQQKLAEKYKNNTIRVAYTVKRAHDNYAKEPSERNLRLFLEKLRAAYSSQNDQEDIKKELGFKIRNKVEEAAKVIDKTKSFKDIESDHEKKDSSKMTSKKIDEVKDKVESHYKELQKNVELASQKATEATIAYRKSKNPFRKKDLDSANRAYDTAVSRVESFRYNHSGIVSILKKNNISASITSSTAIRGYRVNSSGYEIDRKSTPNYVNFHNVKKERIEQIAKELNSAGFKTMISGNSIKVEPFYKFKGE